MHRDVDYLVKDGAIEMVDEFKGRIALDRRWPAGLHSAIEAKEGVAAKSQGMILGQITLHPTMGDYLSMSLSTKNNPNENYAREIVQLFSVGLFMLNQDGTLQLDGTGNPIPTYGQRPNLLGTLKRGSGSPQSSTDPDTGISYFANPDALFQTPDNTFGSASRTISSVRQPGARDVSMSLFKEFPLGVIREGMRLQFRAESFNTFNHPQWRYINAGCSGSPNANGTSAFGRTCGGDAFNAGNGEVNTAWSPRNIQMGMKFNF